MYLDPTIEEHCPSQVLCCCLKLQGHKRRAERLTVEKVKRGKQCQRLTAEVEIKTESERSKKKRWNNRFEQCFISVADICLSLFQNYRHMSKGYQNLSEGEIE